MKNTITFTTRQYELSHMKAPRGWGMWAFEASFGETDVEIWTPGSMTYAEGKKFARARALEIAQRESWTGTIEISAQP